MKPIFVKTRQKYDSYQDFWRLVELAEFQSCFVDEMKLDEPNLYILPTVNAEFRQGLSVETSRIMNTDDRTKKAIVVWWHLERPDASTERLAEIGKGVYTGLVDALPYFDLIWSSDRWWVHQQQMPRKIVFVPMGSHPGLAKSRWWSGSPFQYDLCHFSYVAGRRGPVHGALGASHTIRIAPNGWGEDRTTTLLASKILLNIHQTPVQMGEPLRFAMAAAHGIPMLSEVCHDPYPLDPNVDFIPANYNELEAIARLAIQETPKELEHLGAAMYWRLCIEHPFKTEVLLAVKLTKDIFPGGIDV